MSTYTPSPAQQVVFDWIRNPTGGDGIINAKAGSGKTFTLQKASVLLKGESAVFLAFNQSIATELRKALDAEAKAASFDPERPAMRAMTIHSLARQVLLAMRPGQIRIDDGKYLAIIRDLMCQQGRSVWVRPGAGDPLSMPASDSTDVAIDDDDAVGFSEDGKRRQQALEEALSPLVITIRDLSALARLNLTDTRDPAKLRELAEHHAIELPREHAQFVLEAIPAVLKRGIDLATDPNYEGERVIDFNDMLWVPLQLAQLERASWPDQFRFDWIFVDEAQDLNAAQRGVVFACRGTRKSKQNVGKGRILFVGDPNQAIYGFAGADCDSLTRLAAESKATRMKLDVCRRCPKSHLQLARDIIPGIRPLDTADEGELDHYPSADLAIAKIRELRDAAGRQKPVILVISRRNSPLKQFYAALRSKNIPAKKVGGSEGVRLEELMLAISAEANGGMKNVLGLLGKDAGERYESRLAAGEVRAAGVEHVGQLDDAARSRILRAVKQRKSDLAQLRRLFFNDDAPSQKDKRWPADDAEWNERLQIYLKGRAGEFVQLASIHSSKGLQADYVFIIDAGILPWHARSTRDWQRQQEWHLTYVAFTRAQKALYTVNSRTPRWVVPVEMRALLDAFEVDGRGGSSTPPIGPTPLGRATELRMTLREIGDHFEGASEPPPFNVQSLLSGEKRALVAALHELDKTKEYERALLLAFTIVELAPEDSAAMRALCLRLADLGLSTIASHVAWSASTRTPGDTQLTELVAGLEARHARVSTDERVLWDLVAGESAGRAHFVQLLAALREAGRDDEYVEAAEEALRRNIVLPDALLYVGWVCLLRGDHRAAELKLKHASTIPAASFEAWRILGDLYSRNLRTSDARYALQRALECAPDTDRAKALAAKISKALRALEGERAE